MATAALRRTEVARTPAPPALEPPWQSLREAHLLLRERWARELGRFDLTYSEFVALDLCARGPARASELARALGLTAAGGTDAIDRLESRRLVHRVKDPGDRRVVLIQLSPAGARVLHEGQTAKRATLRYLDQAMTREDRDALTAGLSALVRALKRTDGGG
ncbi:MAG: MarR family transcriptional regulator [Thermoplasmata archaeon]